MIEINLNSIFYDVVHRFKALTPGIMVHWEVFFLIYILNVAMM